MTDRAENLGTWFAGLLMAAGALGCRTAGATAQMATATSLTDASMGSIAPRPTVSPTQF
jgi:hypothetical protein